jgi:hypothetical protein
MYNLKFERLVSNMSFCCGLRLQDTLKKSRGDGDAGLGEYTATAAKHAIDARKAQGRYCCAQNMPCCPQRVVPCDKAHDVRGTATNKRNRNMLKRQADIAVLHMLA